MKMAKLVPHEELTNRHGSGYIETIWLAKEETFEYAEHDVEPVVWIAGEYYMSGGCAPVDRTGIFFKPTDEEYDELDEGDFQKLICGDRIWDSVPTPDEMKNTPWEEEANNA